MKRNFTFFETIPSTLTKIYAYLAAGYAVFIIESDIYTPLPLKAGKGVILTEKGIEDADDGHLVSVEAGNLFPERANYRIAAFIWKEELSWEEDIPEQGILCWAWDLERNKELALVVEYDKNLASPFCTKTRRWKNAVPVTPNEFNDLKLTLLSNQPEN